MCSGDDVAGICISEMNFRLLAQTQCYMTTRAAVLHYSMGAPSGPGVRQASERHQHRKWSHYLTSPGLPGAIEQIM